MDIQNDKLQNFLRSQERAKLLIQMDRKGELDNYKNKKTISEQSYLPRQTEIPQQVKTNSKLPKEIIDSFKNTQFIQEQNVSILDEINTLTNGNLYVNEKEEKENKITSENVDYSMIKMIVENTMKKYMGALKKSLLTENAMKNENNVNVLQFGDKFNFVTKNGDLYEAQLKFIKNIKK